jgi:hypothetical protein
VNELKLQGAAADAAVRYGNEFGRNLTVLQSGGPTGVKDAPSYAQARDVADTVIEISVLNVRAAITGMKNLPVWMFMDGRVRVVRTRDNAQLDTFTVRYFGGARLVDQWLADGGKGIQAELDRGVSTLAEQAVDEVLLIYRHSAGAQEPPSPSPKPGPSQEGPSKPKQQELVPPYALRPIEPPLRHYWLSDKKTNYGYYFEIYEPYHNASILALEIYPLQDLQPTFQWEAFPRGYEVVPGSAPGQASDVRYDLRILANEGIVYERRNLESSSHRLEQPLQPCRAYRWTVRGRFVLNGLGYAMEWTGAYDIPIGFFGRMAPWSWRRGSVPPRAAVPPTVAFYYPIIATPALGGGNCP